LFGGLGQRLSWVGGLGCGETDEFCATEGESGVDEDRAETLET